MRSRTRLHPTGAASAGPLHRGQLSHWVPWLLLVFLLTARTAAAEPCTLGRLGELPVTMIGMRPTVHAKINGTDALFLADSGAFSNLLTPAAATQFKLTLEPAAVRFIVGVGGEARVWLTRVKTFTLLNVDFPNVQFVVAGNDLGNGVVGLLGKTSCASPMSNTTWPTARSG